MCPVLAGVARTVTEALDDEHTCIADVPRALVFIKRDAKARLKE